MQHKRITRQEMQDRLIAMIEKGVDLVGNAHIDKWPPKGGFTAYDYAEWWTNRCDSNFVVLVGSFAWFGSGSQIFTGLPVQIPDDCALFISAENRELERYLEVASNAYVVD